MNKSDAPDIGIKSLVVGYKLLEVLADNMPIGLGELASKGKVSSSRAYKYLTSFQHVGLVRQDPQTRLYSLGDAALRLGCIASARDDDFRRLQQIQTKLRDETAQTVVLSLWSDKGPIIANIETGLSPVVATMKLGTSLPLVSSAAGKVFASCLPWDQVRPLATAEIMAERMGEKQELQSACRVFFQSLQAVRDRGLEHRHGSMLSHINAIAAPFIGSGGRLVGVLSIIGGASLVDISYDGPLALAMRRAQDSFKNKHSG